MAGVLWQDDAPEPDRLPATLAAVSPESQSPPGMGIALACADVARPGGIEPPTGGLEVRCSVP
jgi:hypothetical protein